MRDGAVEQVGTPDEVWGAPANRFVARFVGSPAINLVPADGPLSPPGLPVRAGLELGVRPEHVRLGFEGLPAEVTLVEPVGGEAYVHLRAEGLELVARTEASARPSVGDTVRASVRLADVHLFDAVTGVRVDP
jgi:ABC-type sugar transport system ATPase subunit